MPELLILGTGIIAMLNWGLFDCLRPPSSPRRWILLLESSEYYSDYCVIIDYYFDYYCRFGVGNGRGWIL